MTWRHTKAIGEIGFLFAEGRQPENCSACPGRETEKQEELIHFGEKRPSTAVNYFALSEPANLCLVACRSQWPDPAPPSSSSTVWCCGRLGDVNCSIKGRWPEASGIHCARCNHLRTSQLRLNVMSWILSGRQKSPTGGWRCRRTDACGAIRPRGLGPCYMRIRTSGPSGANMSPDRLALNQSLVSRDRGHSHQRACQCVDVTFRIASASSEVGGSKFPCVVQL